MRTDFLWVQPSGGARRWLSVCVLCSLEKSGPELVWQSFQLHVVLASCLFSGAVSLFHPRKETEAQLGDMCCGGQRKALPLLNSKSNSEMGVVWRVFFGD